MQRSAKHGLVGFAERMSATLFFALFPSDCRICNSPLIEISRLPVCHVCLASLRPLAGTYCSVCGEALNLPRATGLPEIEISEPRCLLCQRVDPPYERAVAYGSYESELRDLIHLLKFQEMPPAASILGRKLAAAISALEQNMPVGKIAVVPVPLYSRKRRQRGFNQAELIARRAVRELRRPGRFELCAGVLLRRRNTESQIGMTSHQRRENLRGAFEVAGPTRIAKRDILLIDDVFTTGSTASECARVLLRAGAARVWVATVARTLKLYGSNLMSMPDYLAVRSTDEGVEVQRAAAHG
jgi:ComF family protein